MVGSRKEVNRNRWEPVSSSPQRRREWDENDVFQAKKAASVVSVPLWLILSQEEWCAMHTLPGEAVEWDPFDLADQAISMASP